MSSKKIETQKISLTEIQELVTNIFLKQGCNQENAICFS